MTASQLDQPALDPVADDPAAGPLISGRASEATILFRDGTWRACRVAAWQRDHRGGWRLLLRWGVQGDWHEGWYLFDVSRVSTAGDGGDQGQPDDQVPPFQ